MTSYSRPACLALIARVESGLTFGQLQPYADALREAVGEVERLGHLLVCEERLAAEGATAITQLTSERDAARDRVEKLETEARKIAEIKARIIPSYGRLEAAVKLVRAEIVVDGAQEESIHLLADFVQYARYQFLMTALYDQPVIEAAEAHRDDPRRLPELTHAVDAYRAARDGEGGK